MTEPTRASEVAVKDDRTEDDKRRQTGRETVARIMARKAALRRSGADLPPSSENLAGDLESRLGRIDERVAGR